MARPRWLVQASQLREVRDLDALLAERLGEVLSGAVVGVVEDGNAEARPGSPRLFDGPAHERLVAIGEDDVPVGYVSSCAAGRWPCRRTGCALG